MVRPPEPRKRYRLLRGATDVVLSETARTIAFRPFMRRGTLPS
jgi:hypothetical protein